MNVEEPVRKPQFAGRFGPVEAEEQRVLLEGWVKPPVGGGPRAAGLVLPHGPWADIGALVGEALSSVRLEEVVVLLAPNHLCRGPRATIVSEGTFVLPTGNVPIDTALAESLRALGGLTELPEVLAREHAIEVLLPLLLSAQPRLSIVPVVLHDLAVPAARRIGHALADAVVARGGVTIVATSNLAHYVPRQGLGAATDGLLSALVPGDIEGFVGALRARERQHEGAILETCGLSTLLVYLEALAHLGGVGEGRVVGRGHSHDPQHPEGSVVAYASLVHPRLPRH